MLRRATVVWFGLLALAIGNAALRELVIAPRWGDQAGHITSSITLSAAIVLVAWATIRWIGPPDGRTAWGIGAFWLVLTVAFEFGAGHYLFGNSWERLLSDYDPRQGRLWLLVLGSTLIAPALAARGRTSGARAAGS